MCKQLEILWVNYKSEVYGRKQIGYTVRKEWRIVQARIVLLKTKRKGTRGRPR